MKRWASKTARTSWQPPCEIYLYPTAKQYAQMTGQPEDSPGYSTMGMNAGKIISRRVNLRTDHPTLVKAVLPHEITHVILADFFTEQQIPRWADEGLAVLAEPGDAGFEAVRAGLAGAGVSSGAEPRTTMAVVGFLFLHVA